YFRNVTLIFSGRAYRSDFMVGCHPAPTPGRDPTTAQHGDFWLLGFPPGPVRPSLTNLATQGSPRVPILMPSLVRTPSQREALSTQDSRPQIILNTRPPSSWITGVRHDSRPTKRFQIHLFNFNFINFPIRLNYLFGFLKKTHFFWNLFSFHRCHKR
ncbi:hypothetical protein L9F63_017069, partial [Diploptera punctata]